MTFSPSTLRLFAELLSQVNIPATHPQIVELATQVAAAKSELDAALKDVVV